MQSFSKIFSVLILFSFILNACSKKDSSDPTEPSAVANQLAAALATVAVSSPTADKSTSSFSIFSTNKTFSTDEVMTVDEQIDAIENQSTKGAADLCFSGIDLNVGLEETAVSCYGPNVQLTGDYPFETATYNGSSQLDAYQNTQGSNGTAPKGDLGLWKSAESSGEACVSAKMNTLVSDASKTVFVTQKLFAAVLCVANHAGKTLPAAGESLDLSSLLTGKLANTTFTSASLNRAASDTAGETTYTLSLAGTISNSEFSLTSKTTESSSTTKGIIYGYKPNYGVSGSVAGFSVVYSQTGTSHKVSMRAVSASNTTGMFNSTTNLIDFAGVSAGQSYYYILSDINTTTNLGKLYLAWQAGGGDSHTRVFRAETSNDGTNDVGFGYFGYGDKINTGTPSLGTINGMICNWAITKGGLYDHTNTYNSNYKSGKAQSQKIQRNASGYFVSTEDKISYAPTFTCDNKFNNNSSNDGAFTVTNLVCPQGASTCQPNEQTASTDAADIKSFATDFANNLITLGSTGYTDVGAITEPTYP